MPDVFDELAKKPIASTTQRQDIFSQLAAQAKAPAAPSKPIWEGPLGRQQGPTELKPSTDAAVRARKAYLGNHHWWTVAAMPFLGNTEAALSELLKDAQGLTQEGRREHPGQAVVGDVTKQVQELNRIVGPEVNLLSAPAALEEAPNIVRNIYRAARDPAAVRGAVEGIFNSLHPRIGRAGVAAQKMQRDIELVAPDLAQISREAPLGKASLGERVKGRGKPEWFSETAQRIDDYKTKLWEQGHTAPVSRHAAMPFDSGKVLQQTLDEIHPEDDSSQARMAQVWARREIPKLRTVKNADTKIRLLNQEIKALPERYGPVGARVRMKAVQSLRNQLDDQLVAAGETGVRDINRRWGGLNAVSGRMWERYFQEGGKIAGKSPLPDWMHAYVFGHPGGAAYGIGIRASRMFMPDDALTMRAAMERLGKSGLRPESIFTPEYVGKKPRGLLPDVGGTYTDVGRKAPGEPRTRRHPIEVHGQVAPRGTELARIPGQAPRTTLPSTGGVFEGSPRTPVLVTPKGRPALPAAPSASEGVPGGRYRTVGPLRVSPETEMAPLREPASARPGKRGVEVWNSEHGRWEAADPAVRATSRMPEVEAHMTHLLRTGKITRAEITRMQKTGVLPADSVARILAAGD